VIGLADGMVRVVPYNPGWPLVYRAEERLLRTLIGVYVKEINHIGSTSIPGLSAKPIIDMMAVVLDYEDGQMCIPILEHSGYQYQGDLGMPGCLVFAKGGNGFHTHYLHILVYESQLYHDYLIFRDYLRSHRDAAAVYSGLKQRLALQYVGDSEAYQVQKIEFILKIISQSKTRSEAG